MNLETLKNKLFKDKVLTLTLNNGLTLVKELEKNGIEFYAEEEGGRMLISI